LGFEGLRADEGASCCSLLIKFLGFQNFSKLLFLKKEIGSRFPAGKEELDNEEEEKYVCAGPGQEGRLKNIMMYADFHQSFSRIVSNHRLSSDNLLNILKDAGKKPPSGEKGGRKKSPFNTLQNEKREGSEQKGSYSKEYASKANSTPKAIWISLSKSLAQ
jgi:hypothetical protein